MHTRELDSPAFPRAATQKRSVHLVLGALTDLGQVKEYNQDSLVVLQGTVSQGDDLVPLALAIVADGMGEDEPGTRASALAVRVVADSIWQWIYRPFLLGIEQSSHRPAIHQALRDAVHDAHAQIRQSWPGGKTTLTCAVVLGAHVFVAHVGDSRVYLIGPDTIRQITIDHSLVNRLVQVGQITPEEAKTHAQRNVLYRALGRDGELDADTYMETVTDGCSLLLCSDGLWGTVSEEIMLSIVHTAPSPQIACHRLVARANMNGGGDNITAVVVRIER